MTQTMKTRNHGIGEAAGATNADISVGQGKLYAPPSSAVRAASDDDGRRKHVADFDTGVDDVHNPDSYSGGRKASLKLAVEKAMEKVKSSLPSESLDKALHVLLDAFRDAQSSTKEAVQRVKDRLSGIFPVSHHSEVETIVDDVERQMLSSLKLQKLLVSCEFILPIIGGIIQGVLEEPFVIAVE